MSIYSELVEKFLERYEKPVVEEYIQGFSGIDPQRRTLAYEIDHEQLYNLLGGNADGHYHLTQYLLEKLENLPTDEDIKAAEAKLKAEDQSLLEKLLTEIADRINADNKLDALILKEKNERDAAVNQEAAERAAGDVKVRNELMKEIFNRTASDNDLYRQLLKIITEETINRINGDAKVEGELVREIADRISEDEKLLKLILEETANRVAGDNKNSRAILLERNEREAQANQERVERQAGDNRLEALILRLILKEQSKREAEIQELKDKLAEEIAARKNADTAINLTINELNFEDIHGMLPGTRVWAWGEPYTDIESYPPKIAAGQVLNVTEGQEIPPYKVTGTYLSNPE